MRKQRGPKGKERSSRFSREHFLGCGTHRAATGIVQEPRSWVEADPGKGKGPCPHYDWAGTSSLAASPRCLRDLDSYISLCHKSGASIFRKERALDHRVTYSRGSLEEAGTLWNIVFRRGYAWLLLGFQDTMKNVLE